MGLAVHEIPKSGDVHIVCGTNLIEYLQWVITDARHDSMANAYHTIVPCLSGRFAFTCK